VLKLGRNVAALVQNPRDLDFGFGVSKEDDVRPYWEAANSMRQFVSGYADFTGCLGTEGAC
jgi:hypothetical protein